jgi:hypothetical protein
MLLQTQRRSVEGNPRDFHKDRQLQHRLQLSLLMMVVVMVVMVVMMMI